MTDKKLLSRLASLTPEQREVLLKQLKKKKSQGAEPGKDTIQPFERGAGNRIAMSFAQQRLWFIDQLQSGSASYNISAALRLRGALDVEALRMSFDEIVRRHEVLRTTFVSEDGQGRQVICEHQRWELPTISLEPLTAEEQEEVIRARYKGDAHTSFDLINGPLLRTRLIRLNSLEHIVIVSMHHIISDGWSMGVFVQEMALLYDAFRQDRTSPLQPLPIQYADYSLWQREWLAGDRLERQLSYWKTRLDGVPVLEFPTDFPRPPVHGYVGHNQHFSFSRQLTEQLNGLARQQGVTLFMVLFAGLQVLLHRYTGQDDICVGTPIAGRIRPEVEKLIGCFVNTLAIRSNLGHNPSFSALLKQVQQNLTGAYDHQDIPFERLVDELGVSREMSHTPLFQVMFVLQNATSNGSFALPGLAIDVLPAESETSKFDFTINMREEQGQLQGDFEYRTDLFEAATITRLLEHFTRLLTELAANPEQGVDDVAYLSAAETRLILQQWNDTAVPYERDDDVLAVFAAVVADHAADIAVVSGQQTISYQQLDNISNHIALALEEGGVRPGDRVGLCAERSAEAIAAMLGILKAGAAYVPLDPEYPTERLQYMLEDTRAPLVLAHSHLMEQLPLEQNRLLVLDGFIQQQEAVAGLHIRVGATAPAYVMYTSGSTGKPKGIEVVHRNLVRLVRNTNFMTMDSDLVFLHYAPISFDAATLELWAPLLNGGRVVVAPNGRLSPEEIGAVITQGDVNAAWFTAALFHYLAEYHLEIFRPLKQLLAGGDVLSPKLVRKCLEDIPGLTLINGYGPTENTTFTCCYPMRSVADVRHTVPIGKPIANTTVYVLDQAMRPVPIGVAGELYTGGDGVANGYLNRDELSAEVFLADPFAAVAEGRLYRTGDLVRYYEDGNLEYLGRVDQQVKIRGYRIELSEVEEALSRINTIREVAVIAREDNPGVKRLVAYYVAVQDSNPTVTELRAELKQQLPDYMIPAAFVALDALPVTANGKLDRRGLPKPAADSELAQRHVAPSTERETVLAEIWKQVLNLEEVGIRDNFFEMGGDSILSIQIISRAKLAGLHITTKQIFENQTIEELAAVASEAESPVLAEQGLLTGESPLAPIQHWFFEHEFGQEQHWNQSVLLDLKPGQHISAAQLNLALSAVMEQHDALRLRYQRRPEAVVQYFATIDDAFRGFSITQTDLSAVAAEEEAQQLTAACNQIQQSLDLQQGPLLAAGLITLAGERQKLLLVIHHLVIDGVSWRILLEDFNTALDCAQKQAVIQLGQKTTSYRQWITALQQEIELGHFNNEIDYWEQVIEQEKPALPLDFAHAGTHADGSATLTCSVQLSEALTQSLLRDVHHTYRTEINDLLLTALAKVICDWSGNHELYLELEGHGREAFTDQIDLSRTVGWFTSVFPVRIRYENGQSVQDNLKAIKEQLRQIPAKGFGFGALRYLGNSSQNRFLQNAPVADIVFNYLGQFNTMLEHNPWFALAKDDRGREHSEESHETHALTVNSHIVADRLHVDWIFSSALFASDTITKLANQYLLTLEQLVLHCIQPGTFGYTPSDFPLSGLSQNQIDRLIGGQPHIESVYPLSPMQEGMLFHSLFDNEDGVYFEQLSVEVLGSVNRELLKQAWITVVNRHPALRSAFVWQDIGRPLQIVQRAIDMEIVELDWRHHGEAQVQERLAAWLEKDRQRGFNFDKAGLMRLAWLDMPDNRSRLIWSFHHVVLDGWSLPLVMGEVFQTYGMLTRGETARLPQAGSYEDFISYLEQQDKGDALQFWKLYLAGFESATVLPNRRHSAVHADKVFLENELVLDTGFTLRLQQFARENHVTLNTVIQAAWGVLLARYSGDRDVVFGTTVSGRPADLTNVENIVGLFINTLPLRIQLQRDTTIVPLLKTMQDEQLDLRRFEFTPLVDIHRVSEIPGDQSLFDSILVFENYPVGEAVHSAGELLDFGQITTIEHTNYPLTLIVEPGDKLRAKLSYDASLFDSATIARVLEHMKTLLHGILSQPGVPLLRLPMLSEIERTQILHEWNPAPANYPRNLCLHHIFERHVKAHPERVALVAGELELSYADLNRQANSLARYLIEHGVAEGDFVAIALERSVDMIVSILAILKVGAAYVPVDPDYPQDRMQYMLRDAGVPVVLTHSRWAERLKEVVLGGELSARLILLDQEQDEIARRSSEALLLAFSANPSRHAYVIYTSGSTGRPKGVLVRQLSVIRLVLDANYFTLDPGDRVCHVSNVSFDAAIFDVWAPLLNGSAMVLFSKDQLLNPDLFLAEMVRTGANVAFLTSALFNMYMATEQRIVARFKNLMVGGEALDPNVIRTAIRQCKPKYLQNLYGPTENTTFSCFKDLTYIPEHATNVPVGRAVSGSTAYVLDDFLQPVPIGVKGELYVGGDGVAVGYLNDPERTGASFMPDPFSADANGQLYRTGDIARYNEEGEIEILGRADDQVKVRGFRIELREVETNLSRIDLVQDAVVLVKTDASGQKRLVAYVKLVAGADVARVRQLAADYLPKHMLPASFTVVEQFALTSNGKIDKRALPEPVFENTGSYEYTPPRTDKERSLVAIWEQVLKADTVGIHDNFFELGGDSILSIQVISRAKRAGIHITAKQIFEYQTIASLCEVARELQDMVLAEQGLVAGEFALTPVQNWFFAHQHTDAHHFNQSLMLQVDKRVSVEQVRLVLEAVIYQHDMFRARFQPGDSGWQQYYQNVVSVTALLDTSFEQVSLAGLPANLRGDQIEHIVAKAQSTLNLAHGPVARFLHFDLGDDLPARLAIVVHHLVIDVFSWRVLLEDMQSALAQVVRGAKIDLGAKTTSFKQWSEALHSLAQSGALQSEFEFWRVAESTAGGAIPLDAGADANATLDSARNSVGSVRVVEQSLSSELTRKLLQSCSSAYNTEINDLLLAALFHTFAHWTGGHNLLVDLEGHGREHISDQLDVSRTMGWFTSIYPVPLSVTDYQHTGNLIKSVKQQLRNVPRKGLSYGLYRYLGAVPAPANVGRSQISFNYLGQLDQVAEEGGLLLPASESCGPEISNAGQRQYLLEISARVMDGQLKVAWRYSSNCHLAATIEQRVTDYLAQLQTIIEHCSSGQHFGYTPADFPLAGLDQQQVDQLATVPGIETIMPLSPVQEGMLFHALYEPGSWVYFDQIMVPISGPVQEAALFDAWRHVVARHQILRTGFVWEGLDKPLQVVVQDAELDIQFYDWSVHERANAEARFERLLRDDRNLGFNFRRHGVMRLSWVKFPGQEHRLIWSFHHVLLDGWSMPVVFGELFATYEAIIHGRQVQFPAAPRYQDFIGWLSRQDQVAAAAFWREYLAGFTATTAIPLKNSLAQVQQKQLTEDSAARYREQETRIGGLLLKGLQDLAKRYRITLNHLLQGVWGLLLSRYSGEQDVVFGTTVSGRPAELAGIEQMVGLFINTLPMRLEIKPAASFIDWLQEQQARQNEIKNFEYSSLVEVQKASELSAKQALFESILVFENYPIDETLEQTQASLNIGQVDAFQQTNFPLTLIVIPGQELVLRFSYDSYLFEQSSIERILGHIEHVLTAVQANPAIRLGDMPLLGAREEQQLLQDWNKTAREFPSDATLVELFEQQVTRHPNALAWEHGHEKLTYDQLNRRVNKLARGLVAAGVEPGQDVAISFQRSLAMLESMLAVLKAGAAYVPVDPEYPQERIEHILADTASPVLLTSTQHRQVLQPCVGSGAAVILELEDLLRTSAPLSDLDLQIQPDQGSRARAYVIYTSGSTGKPKGVCVPQQAVSRLVMNTDFVQLRHGQRMGHASNVSFDAATFEFWGALLNGGTLVCLDRDTTLDPARFANAIVEQQIDVLFVTTALFNALARENPQVFAGLEYCLFGGEACDPNQVRAVLDSAHAPRHLLHVYGPTENTTFSTWHEVTAVLPGSTTIPIGRPIANSTLYVLDAASKPVPVGVIGEIHVGGRGLADGYLNRDDLTAAAFIAHPYKAGERLYKTGDLGRLLSDGSLEISGRVDDQVKIRGYRIELGEIETALNQLPAISESSVVVRTLGNGSKQLLAYCARAASCTRAANAIETPVAELKARLRQQLPDYMVPSAIILLDRLPLNANGKVDKRALPEPTAEDFSNNEFVAARNPMEQILVAIWSEVLEQERVGIYDDFFDLGGHSLLITKVGSRLKQQTGIELPLRTLFEVPTIAALAEIMQSLAPLGEITEDDQDEEDYEEGSL